MGDNQERDDGAAGIAAGQDRGSHPGQVQQGAGGQRSGAAIEDDRATGATGAPQRGDADAGMQGEVGDIAADDADDGSLPGRMGGGLAGA